MQPLTEAMQPRPCLLDLQVPPALLDAVEAELIRGAAQDANHCWGYFPALSGRVGVCSDLPHSKQLSAALSMLEVQGKKLHFNFVRFSSVRQHGLSSFHVDTDAATAITGDPLTIRQRKVWRLLLNLSNKHYRQMDYLDLDPFSVELYQSGGYLALPEELATEVRDVRRQAKLLPRRGCLVAGVLFCSNHVLHAGNDGEQGHFVAGYGCEEDISAAGLQQEEQSIIMAV